MKPKKSWRHSLLHFYHAFSRQRQCKHDGRHLERQRPLQHLLPSKSPWTGAGTCKKMTDDSVIFKAYDTRKQLESALKKRRIQIAFGSIDAFNVNQDVFDVSEPYLYEPNVLFRRSDGKRKTIKSLRISRSECLRTAIRPIF